MVPLGLLPWRPLSLTKQWMLPSETDLPSPWSSACILQPSLVLFLPFALSFCSIWGKCYSRPHPGSFATIPFHVPWNSLIIFATVNLQISICLEIVLYSLPVPCLSNIFCLIPPDKSLLLCLVHVQCGAHNDTKHRDYFPLFEKVWNDWL